MSTEENMVVLTGDFRDLKNAVKIVHPKKVTMPFKTLYAFDSEQALISEPHHNGDWQYYFVVRAMDWREAACDDTVEHYNVSLHVVSPQAAGIRACIEAVNSAGFDVREFPRGEARNVALVEMLLQYGHSARLSDGYGNNLRELIREAKHEAFKASSLLGFYMDRRQNAFGDTGWDWVAGNLAGSKDRAHEKYLADHGLTEEQYQDAKASREEQAAKNVTVPVKLDPYVGGKKVMPLDVAHKLWRAGKITFVERYVGGFADQGGYWRGADERLGVAGFDEDASQYGSTTVGDPPEVLRQKRDSKARFIVSLDEQGQFQTYWSLWKIV